MRYRRTDVAGATYFFTVNLAERHCTLLTDHIATLRTVMRGVKQRHPFHVHAMVILPDHLHCVWTLPEGDADYPLRWALIKAGFSRHIPETERRNSSRVDKGERGVWQRRYWEHMIRDERDYARHVDYIHYNPVKHGYVPRAAEWPYSSIHRYIVAGTLTRDWGVGEVEEDGRSVNADGCVGVRCAHPNLRGDQFGSVGS
jgi:putative transposase